MQHPSALATPIRPQQSHTGPPPPPIQVVATPPRNRVRSKSDPLGYPPDNWIPVANDSSYIAMPPPHHMSPAPSPVTMEPPVRIPSSAPVPPPPIVAEEATTETPTSETSSETVPPQPAVRKDYAYHAAKLRERDERRPQRSRTPTPLSPGSTRISDYGIVSSPQVDSRKMKAPSQLHFEIERSSTPTRERASRGWSSRTKREVTIILVVILLFCRCSSVIAVRIFFTCQGRCQPCAGPSSRHREHDRRSTAKATGKISVIQNNRIVFFVVLVDLNCQSFLEHFIYRQDEVGFSEGSKLGWWFADSP